MKQIVVATDLSPRSDHALERAARLALESNAALTVISAIDDDLPDRIAKPLAQETRARMEEQVAALGVKAKTRVIYGRHFEAILGAASDHKADLVVLGKHRKGKSLELFRGSTGERVIRYGRTPVLVVRDRPKKAYQRILVGIDFSRASLRAVEYLARNFKTADIQVVHAFDMPFAGLIAGVKKGKTRTAKDEADIATMVKEEWRAFLKSLPAAPKKLAFQHEIGSPEEVLRRLVKAKKPDLLAVGTHGRGTLARAVIGSVAENLLRDPPCDVLAVKF